MDWPSHIDPFFYEPATSFTCDLEAKDKLHCRVLYVYETDGRERGVKLEKIILSKPSRWQKWFNDTKIFPEGDDFKTPCEMPKNGICILPIDMLRSFIPRAANVQEEPLIEASLTDIPLRQADWDRISQAFWLLPGHLVKAIGRKATCVTSISRKYNDGTDKDKLWMNIATTAMPGPDVFALASTYFDRAKLTLATMIGCSYQQMKMVESLLEGSEDAIRHPLLMLGIYTELQLERLKKLVYDKVKTCQQITRRLAATRRPETGAAGDSQKLPREEITWELINQVRTSREESKRAEEEVKATKRQLEKSLPPALKSLLNQSEHHNSNNVIHTNPGNNNRGDDNGSSTSINEPELDEDDEITYMFEERFTDIFAQFEGMIAECRISVEEMSFTADTIRSELARQEARSSGQEAKISTVIAFVAMLYLPMTTTAAIFAMPIFQFANDWRDWRYHRVGKANLSDSSSSIQGGSGLPVFSGYFWIYLGISLAFTLITVEGWWRFTSREVPRRQGKHWSIYLGQKTWKHIKRININIPNFVKKRAQTQSTKQQNSAPPSDNNVQHEQSDVDSESEKTSSPFTLSKNLAASQSPLPQQTSDVPGNATSRNSPTSNRNTRQQFSSSGSGSEIAVNPVSPGTKSNSRWDSGGSSSRDTQSATGVDLAIKQEKEALNAREGHENV